MLHTFARAVLASAIALGALVFSAGSALPGDATTMIDVPAAKSSTASTSMFAPLWVYPSTQAAYPVPIAAAPGNTRSAITIREQPSLLRPADLHFSVENEAGVTVVRGPIAR